MDIDPAVLTGLEVEPLRTGEGASASVFSVIESVVNDPEQPGLVALTATCGSDESHAIRTSEAIAIVRLRANGPGDVRTGVTWRLCAPIDDRCPGATVLRSRAVWDQEGGGENVLGRVADADIIIAATYR